MAHFLFDAQCPPPPLERIVADGQPRKAIEKGETYEMWPTRLMVCRYCYEVQLHSHHPRPAELDEKGKRAIVLIMSVVNPGNGSGLCVSSGSS